MLSADQMREIERLASGLDERQIAWLSGYLAGMRPPAAVPVPATAPPPSAPPARAAILFGSQTGNAQGIAEQLAEQLRQKQVEADVFSMADYKTARLKKEKYLFAVISTHGEGEPPDSAVAFHEFLRGPRAPSLAGVSYSVLALGDSSYEHFCRTGREMNARLRELGAVALAEMAECDVDFERDAARWRTTVAEALSQSLPASAPAASAPAAGDVVNGFAAVPAPASQSQAYTRSNPLEASVLASVALNGAPRRTRHLEFATEELQHRPGDSLGVWPENSRDTAESVAEGLGLEWEEEIRIDDESAPASEWLLRRLDIAMLTPAVLARYNKIAPSAPSGDAAAAYAKGRGLPELLRDFPPPGGAGEPVLGCLRRLAPRLYSLASSNAAREGESHILVGRQTYVNADGALRDGVCSEYLRGLREGDVARVFVQPNDNFRPPPPDAPLIMIGPGTGIAPFRAFLEERDEQGAGGKSWLFFGERRRREDFYYQSEWRALRDKGSLHRMNAAFSRDGTSKIYVQDRLRNHARDVWAWLEEGAHVYVCGDEKRMARDVHAALAEIAVSAGGEADGEAYLKKIREAGRYRRDVY